MEENNFSEWLLLEEKNYNEIPSEMQNILETKPLLSSKDIYLLVDRINSYYFYKKDKKKKLIIRILKK